MSEPAGRRVCPFLEVGEVGGVGEVYEVGEVGKGGWLGWVGGWVGGWVAGRPAGRPAGRLAAWGGRSGRAERGGWTGIHIMHNTICNNALM